MLLLLSLAFADQAFKATSLKSPKDIIRLLSVPLQKQALQFEWKDSMLDVPIFRSLAESHVVHSTKALPYCRLLQQLKSLGAAAGYKGSVTPYYFRRGAANALVKKKVPSAVRRLVLGHKENRTFEEHYIALDVRADTQGAYLGEDANEDTLEAMGSMLITKDIRAPNALTIEQRREVDKDPEVAKLLVKRNEIRKFLQQKYRSLIVASKSSDPTTVGDYNTFVKAKRKLDVASRGV